MLYSRRVALERCCIPSPGMCPTCLHLFASTLSPAVEAMTDRGGLLLPLLRLCPSCYSGALCSNKCLLCHTSPLQCNRFTLPLSYTPPLLPAHSPTFTQSHKHTLSHTRSQNTNGVSSLKTWLCSLMIFLKWKWGGGWRRYNLQMPDSLPLMS